MSTINRKMTAAWVADRFFDGLPTRDWLRTLITPANVLAAALILGGVPFIVQRYVLGLASVTHASNDQPWGLFLSWGLFSGVPLASTGFLMASAVYLFGLRSYAPLLRPAVLTGLIGYFFAVVFLLIDLGMPWRLPYPLVWSFGTASVMFLVAWHVALYLSTQFVELSPAVFEWLGADRLRRWGLRVAVGATIFGVILSTLHQSALGALFLLAPAKLHPLWYTPYLPLLFLVSSIYAGLAMIILESTLVMRFMPKRMDPEHQARMNTLVLGLGRGAAVVLLTYFGLKWVAVAHGHHWHWLSTSYGVWFLVEMFGFVLLPCLLFVRAVRQGHARRVRWAALIAIVGIIANRLTVSLLAFNWQMAEREFLYWKEVVIIVAVVTIEVVVYRWLVNHLPIHRKHPRYGEAHS